MRKQDSGASNIEFVEEPAGDTYRALVRLAVSCCDRFYLVWRDQLEFNPEAYRIASELKPWLLQVERTDTWDGTRLLGHYATVSHYALDSGSAKLLAAAGRLYAWESPGRPEDLTFYTSAGALWMLSIAHERAAHFDGCWVSLGQLRNEVPGLVLRPSQLNVVSFLDRSIPR